MKKNKVQVLETITIYIRVPVQINSNPFFRKLLVNVLESAAKAIIDTFEEDSEDS